MMVSLFIYTVQRSVTVTGLVHLVLWSQWHSSRPSLKQLLVGSAAMSFFCSTLQHPIFITAIDYTLWIRAFANYLLTIAWYVMLFRAASAWFAYELAPTDSEPKARSHRGWTVSGMLQSATLVAITIVTKQWIHTHFIETAPSSTPGYSIWINVASEVINVLDAFVLAYAAAAFFSRRHIMIPISIIAASFAIHCVVSLFITEMLPTFYARPEFIDLLYSISLSIFATLAMQWAAFRVWKWAGYEVRPARSGQPSVSSTG
ncbi:membrane protein [Rhodopirellula sallentina SM41]|uniref:Membrane protein n=2 Tax=Rhodopirellula TaxID=265488 RepID=M5UER3_9BACT|nr:membrane protein [Rhodopirellula sallentina SM41]